MLELLIAIVAMGIWEIGRRLVLWIRRWQRKRSALRKILSFSGEVVFAHSTVTVVGQPTIRESDAHVEQELTEFATNGATKDHKDFSIENPARDLVVIGSPRYNEKATLIQQYFNIPFQFVFSHGTEESDTRRLSIITEFGEELVSSPDYLGAPLRLEVDYGILLVAKLAQGKRLVWLAGIHGIGTLGIYRYLRQEANEVAQDLPTEVDTASVRLLRITYEPSSVRDRARIRSVELLGDPRPARKRGVNPCRAIVMDLGNVLMDFDRNRTYRALAHHLDRDSRDIRKSIESSDLRSRYELGAISSDEFFEQLRATLKVQASELPNRLLGEYWGDIFWERSPIRMALTDLKDQGVFLGILSNTNEIHFQHVTRDYPDLIDLFDIRILSYEQHLAKPDPGIYSRTLESIRTQRPNIDAGQVVFVDDIEEHVQAATSAGMQGFVYRSYPHFVFWLRQQGLYLS